MKRTRLSVCQRKVRYPSLDEALAAAIAGGWQLRPYQCDRCSRFHLTSRRKGRHTPRVVLDRLLPAAVTSGTGESGL